MICISTKRRFPSRCASAMPPPTWFPFFKLPLELRWEIYRHYFKIYPGARCSPTLDLYEINFYPPPEDTTIMDYRVIEGPSFFHTSCPISLSILQVCHAIFAEAMPLFYPETFFLTSWLAKDVAIFLQGVGARRRKYIRHNGFSLSEFPSHDVPTTYRDMKKVVDCLVGSDCLETVEVIAIERGLEKKILSAALQNICALNEGMSVEGLVPLTLPGFSELHRLKFLGTLKLVGNMEKIIATFPTDIEWFKELQEKEWTATVETQNGSKITFLHRRTKVVYHIPRGIERLPLRLKNGQLSICTRTVF